MQCFQCILLTLIVTVPLKVKKICMAAIFEAIALACISKNNGHNSWIYFIL